MHDFDTLREHFAGTRCLIVGTGPSAVSILPKHGHRFCVVGINRAVSFTTCNIVVTLDKLAQLKQWAWTTRQASWHVGRFDLGHSGYIPIPEGMDYDMNSATLACSVADRLGLEAGIIGVDFVGHHQLAGDQVLPWYRSFFKDRAGFVSLSPISALNELLPYRNYRDWLADV